jgi:hypothetical protein
MSSLSTKVDTTLGLGPGQPPPSRATATARPATLRTAEVERNRLRGGPICNPLRAKVISIVLQ